MYKKKLFFAAMALVFGLTACGKAQPVQPQETEETAQMQENETPETEVQEETQEPDVQEETAQETGHENMIKNADFSAGVGTWTTYLNGGQAELEVNADEQLCVRISDVGNLDYSVQAYYDGIKCDKGVKYKLAFDMAVDKPRTVVWRIQLNGGDYHAYFTDTIAAEQEMRRYEYELTMEEDSDPAPRLCFNLGVYEGDGDLGNHTVMLDNFEFYVLDDSGKSEDAGAAQTPDILINQVGYRSGDVKRAVFRGESIGSDFEVVDADSNKSVFTGKITKPAMHEASQEMTAAGDFTSVVTPGRYIIRSEGCGESYPFVIAEDAYDGLLEDVLRMMYLQRCGTELSGSLAGDFAHPACHTGEAVIYGTSDKKDVSGGWHDAGDYGRYVVSGAKTVADLLLAYEANPALFTDDMKIPESGNGAADLLDEVRYELEWMLKMQDKSGGVYHKVTCANFPGTVMPQEETQQLLIAPISNTATGDFAAVMAMAGRIYKETDGAFADTCLAAARKAYTYLEAHRKDAGFVNPSDIVTGEYPDGCCEDEYLWASAELYRTTGDGTYEDAIEGMNLSEAPCGLGWADVGLYGIYAYLSCERTNPIVQSDLLNQWNALADALKTDLEADAYGAAFKGEYPWGSNMTIANNGMQLLMAQKLTKKFGKADVSYQNGIQQQLDYLLGANANGYCFVTGYGSLSPLHTHHRPSQAQGKSMTGMLVGGPNSNLDDPYAQAALAGAPRAKCYADNEQSYSCNEVTVYWNSPLVYLLSGILAE